MLTIEGLNKLGVNTKEGLARCMNNESFYFRMISMGIHGDEYDKLKEALEAKDLDKGFELAHALKGVTGNLSLTPLYNEINEITELLRARTDMDYTSRIEKILAIRKEILALADG